MREEINKGDREASETSRHEKTKERTVKGLFSEPSVLGVLKNPSGGGGTTRSFDSLHPEALLQLAGADFVLQAPSVLFP